MSLSLVDVEHIADLARIELSEQEKHLFKRQISSVLEYVHLLDEVDTDNVEITSQVTGLQNVYREDKVVVCDTEIRNNIIANFPQTENSLLKVKGVFG